MTTRPIWTRYAIAAFAAGDEPCIDCGGHGRIRTPRGPSACETCAGSGIPLSIKEAFDLGFSRDGWKVARQITKGARA